MTKDIERLRSYFTNPENAESAEDLAIMSAESIKVMAQIYATGGQVEKMSPESRIWLEDNFESQGGELEDVLKMVLKEELKTRRFDSGFMGQIHPQGSKIGVLANMIAAYMNTNTIVKEVSESEHGMELEATKWLAEMFGYDPEQSTGNITVGGTTANLAALWVAREKIIKERDYYKMDLDKPMHVLSNSMAHYSIEKASLILGHNIKLHKIPTTGFKSDVCAIEKLTAKLQSKGEDVMAIVGLAGETETGEVDDFERLADVAEKYGVYLHADAAYGGPFILSRAGWRFKGISRANSITVDPHKMLFTPYNAGAILFKDKEDHALIQRSARYLEREAGKGVLGPEGKRNFGFAGRVEGTLGAAGVIATWATMKLLGNEGVGALADHTLDLADYAYNRCENSALLRSVNKPELNTMLVGLKPELGLTPEEYDKLIEKTQEILDSGRVSGPTPYISYNGEVDNGRSAFRYIGMHPYTTEAHVEKLFSKIEEILGSLLENR